MKAPGAHYPALLERLERANARARAYRAALIEFGMHKSTCAFVEGARPCSCGLVAVSR